jgi:hypothetical protein
LYRKRKAGALVFRTSFLRPLRTNWFIVGKSLPLAHNENGRKPYS